MRAYCIILVGIGLCLGQMCLAQAVEEMSWIRTNLTWQRVLVVEPTPIVDLRRIEAQIAQGCTQSPVRFGDTATMRQQVTPEAMDEAARRAVSFASFARDYETAANLIGNALADGKFSNTQRQILENQLVLTAIQFGRLAEARRLLQLYPTNAASLPASLQSDRLFWSVLAASDASRRAWAQEHLPMLDAAKKADPTSFQVLSWRVLGWMRAKPWKSAGLSCPPLIADFSDRLLDLSDAGACPLMLGHFGYAIDRDLAEQVVWKAPTDMSAWRHFALGILAVIVDDTAVHGQASADLALIIGEAACADAMLEELSLLEDRFIARTGE